MSEPCQINCDIQVPSLHLLLGIAVKAIEYYLGNKKQMVLVNYSHVVPLGVCIASHYLMSSLIVICEHKRVTLIAGIKVRGVATGPAVIPKHLRFCFGPYLTA